MTIATTTRPVGYPTSERIPQVREMVSSRESHNFRVNQRLIVGDSPMGVTVHLGEMEKIWKDQDASDRN